MTVNDPEYRREEVRVTQADGSQVQQEVVENVAAQHYLTVLRVSQVIWLMFGIVESLILIRVLLRLIGANPASGFAALIYGVSDIFLWPFLGLTVTPQAGIFALDLSAIIGMIIYLLVGWVIVRLVWLLFYRPPTRSVTTYRRSRL
jgi:uncharacterized membrane protein